MQWIDWLIVIVYLILTLIFGTIPIPQGIQELGGLFCIWAIPSLVAGWYQYGSHHLFH